MFKGLGVEIDDGRTVRRERNPQKDPMTDGTSTHTIIPYPTNGSSANKPGCVAGNPHISLGANTHGPSLGDASKTHGGDAGIANKSLINLGATHSMKVEEIIERFLKGHNTSKSGSDTKERYSYQFRRFAKHANLERYTLLQLKGPKGHDLIVAYLKSLPDGSKRFCNSAISAVWRKGLGLDYPVNLRDEFGDTLAPAGEIDPYSTPPDSVVKPILDALEKEPDIYQKSLIAVACEHGFRPEQVAKLKWRNILWNRNDSKSPTAFFADGRKESMKKPTDIVAAMPDFISDIIREWHAKSPDTAPEAPIWPWRAKRGNPFADTKKMHYRESVERTLYDWLDQWGISREFVGFDGTTKKLTPYSFRNWVKKKSEGKLSEIVFEHRQGRKTEGYGRHRDIEEILDDQRLNWPEGALGDLREPTIKIQDEDEPKVWSAYCDYRNGKTRLSELMDKLEILKAHWKLTDLIALQ